MKTLSGEGSFLLVFLLEGSFSPSKGFRSCILVLAEMGDHIRCFSELNANQRLVGWLCWVLEKLDCPWVFSSSWRLRRTGVKFSVVICLDLIGAGVIRG